MRSITRTLTRVILIVCVHKQARALARTSLTVEGGLLHLEDGVAEIVDELLAKVSVRVKVVFKV